MLPVLARRAGGVALDVPRVVDLTGVLVRAALPAAILVALFVRLRPVLATDFPLNDGGMFFTIVRDIQSAGHALPHTLSYNALDLPFAYPPLAFYLAAALDGLGVPLVQVFRFLPAVLATCVVIAFARLALRLTRDEAVTAIATFAFAVVPASYTWLVMGGGLTRALGLLFVLLALERLVAYHATRSRPAQVAAGVFAGLAVLSHMEMAWVLCFSGLLMYLGLARDRRALAGSLAIAALAAIVAAPWLLSVASRHGLGPLLAASGTGSLDNPFLNLAIFRQSDEPWFPLFAALAALGSVRAIGARRWLLPAWIVAIGILDSRSFGIVSAVPMAILGAIAIRDVVAPLVRSTRLRVVLGALAIAYSLVVVTQTSPTLLRPITADERAAMSFVASSTSPVARFLVVTERGWAENAVGEWFPALAARPSVTTVQGYEWLPDRAFWTQLRRFFAAQSCASRDSGCLDALAASWSLEFDHVYLSKATLRQRADNTDEPCCGALRESLRADDRYALVYDGPGATIFRRVR